jgi:hypothetical protein
MSGLHVQSTGEVMGAHISKSYTAHTGTSVKTPGQGLSGPRSSPGTPVQQRLTMPGLPEKQHVG